MRIAALLLCLAACQPVWGPGRPVPDPFDLQTPAITSFSLECDLDDERWELEVEASAWTGGGRLWWSDELDYLESHPVRSGEAEADGTGDRLVLNLPIVADWRDATPGSSTAFLCADSPSGVLVIYEVDGEEVADCVTFGGDAAVVMQREGVPGCEEG